MKKAGLLVLVSVLIVGGMVTTGVVMAAGNGNKGIGNQQTCPMVDQQGQMGIGQGNQATLTNKGDVGAGQNGTTVEKGKENNPGTLGNAPMPNQGQRGKGQTKMAQTIATHANKPVDEVLEEKKPGVPWLEVAEKYGVTWEQIQQENIKQCPGNGIKGNGVCKAQINNGQTN